MTRHEKQYSVDGAPRGVGIGSVFAILLCALVDSQAEVIHFDFEDDQAGWHVETKHNSKGVMGVTTSIKKKKRGSQSMLITLDLNGMDPVRSSGEVIVDVRRNSGSGQLRGVNMDGGVIEMMVFAPRDAMGDIRKPNGLQIFVKDEEWRSEYGPWVPIQSGRWMRLRLEPSSLSPKGGDAALGFDPKRVALIGIRVATPPDSKSIYQGPIYIDEITCQLAK